MRWCRLRDQDRQQEMARASSPERYGDKVELTGKDGRIVGELGQPVPG
jgi:hypothetical protein